MDGTRAEKIERLRTLMDSVPPDAGDPAPGGRRRRGSRGGNGDGGSLSPEKAAWTRVVALCGHSEFCRAKMLARLAREGVRPQDAEAAVERAVRIGLIDDARWGEMRAAALMRRGTGIPGVERELRDNGIDPQLVAGWPGEFAERFGDEFDRALAVLGDARPRGKNPRASAYGRLLRKGYSTAVAASASGAWAARLGDGA